jgi:hypothetical protein
MLPCVRCGETTELLVMGVPLCLKCDALLELETQARYAAVIKRNDSTHHREEELISPLTREAIG